MPTQLQKLQNKKEGLVRELVRVNNDWIEVVKLTTNPVVKEKLGFYQKRVETLIQLIKDRTKLGKKAPSNKILEVEGKIQAVKEDIRYVCLNYSSPSGLASLVPMYRVVSTVVNAGVVFAGEAEIISSVERNAPELYRVEKEIKQLEKAKTNQTARIQQAHPRKNW